MLWFTVCKRLVGVASLTYCNGYDCERSEIVLAWCKFQYYCRMLYI